MELHAHRAEDGAHRTGGASLFADHLADVLGGDAQLEDRVFFPNHRQHFNGCWFIDQSARDLANELFNCNHVLLGHALAPDRSAFAKVALRFCSRIVSARRGRRQLVFSSKRRRFLSGECYAAAGSAGAVAGNLATILATMGESCAPTPRQWAMRSCFSSTEAGLVRGL